MNKLMIISAGSIHTFDKIKEAAEYKFKFLCHYKSDEENKELWDKFIDYFDLKNINL